MFFDSLNKPPHGRQELTDSTQTSPGIAREFHDSYPRPSGHSILNIEFSCYFPRLGGIINRCDHLI